MNGLIPPTRPHFVETATAAPRQQEKWSAVYTAEKVLVSIQALLAGKTNPPFHNLPSRTATDPPSDPALLDPNNDSPLNPAAANMWHNQSETAKMVRRKWEEAGGENARFA